jgi:hypothetical protein
MRENAERAYAAKAEVYKRLSLNGQWAAASGPPPKARSMSGFAATSSGRTAGGSSGGAGAGAGAGEAAVRPSISMVLPQLFLASLQVEQDPCFLALHSVSHILQVRIAPRNLL